MKLYVPIEKCDECRKPAQNFVWLGEGPNPVAVCEPCLWEALKLLEAEKVKECQLAQNRIAELEKLCTTLSKPIADLLTAGVAFPTNVMPDIMTIKKLHGLK